MSHPKLLTQQELNFNSGVSAQVAYDFDQGLEDAASIDPTAFHYQGVDGTFYVGDTIEDVSDETVTMNFVPGPPGYTSLNGSTTMIRRNGVVNADHEEALPFVNRRPNPYPVRVDHLDTDANTIEIHWNEPVTLNDFTDSAIFDGTNVYEITGLVSGDTTANWVANINSTGTNSQPAHAFLSWHVGADADGAPTAETTLPISTP